MKRAMAVIGLFVMILASCLSYDDSQETPTSSAMGIYNPNEKTLLQPAFITGVNLYLRRYGPRLIEQSDDYVKMTAKYGYMLDIELLIRERDYVIIVTVAEKGYYNQHKGQSLCAKIATGVHKSFENQLIRRTRVRDRSDGEDLMGP